MDKNAIKKYAVWARKELIARIAQKASKFGVLEKNSVPANADSINGVVLTSIQKKQRQALLTKIGEQGYEQTIEEVAYTWFNRFIALRFMEVNGYLPSHVRVFTDSENNFKPEIMSEAINMDLDGINIEHIYSLKEANMYEELFRYMLILQCNALNKILPVMFQKLEDYTELLLPDNLLRDGSVIQQLIAVIPETDWLETVEIIGWLYQYYISDKHDEVIDPLHGKEIKKEEVPAATQLFTTDWVVKYIVDNSLGRYWLERKPESSLIDSLEYFVKDKNSSTLLEDVKQPENITVLDPCVGSGHFLVYAFDLLMKIYRECGYRDRDAVAKIITKNLYGLDIDYRAVQLAYFAIMMKGRQYDNRFFKRSIKPNIYEIKETNFVDDSFVDFFCGKDNTLKFDVDNLINSMKDAKEYGSILHLPNINFERIINRYKELEEEPSIYITYLLEEFSDIVYSAKLISDTYSIVITNPPYLNKYDSNLKKYVIDNYKDYSGDLFSVFIYRNLQYCKNNGYVGMLTPNVWLSIKSYEQLRKYILDYKSIKTLVQMAHGAFNEVACVDVCAFVLNNNSSNDDGIYFKLSSFKGNMDSQKEAFIKAIDDKQCEYKFFTNANSLKYVPGVPITAFCASEKMLAIYKNAILLSAVAEPKQGIATSDNNRFLRLWYEVNNATLNLHCQSHEESLNSKARWYPYNKGGNFRKWYGNNDFVVDWYCDGLSLKAFKGAVLRNPSYYFKECISWSLISSYTIAFRYKPKGHLFDVAGMSCFRLSEIPLYYLLALNNSCLIGNIMMMLAPTINYQVGNIANIPVLYSKEYSNSICSIAEENIMLCKEDWDEYEVSWDFKRSPLNLDYGKVEEKYFNYKNKANKRFEKLARNEQYLNALFLKIYNLEDEITDDINRRDISVTYIYDEKEQITDDISESYYVKTKKDIIKNFVSYAVGCMFGRYSLDVEGLVYAGGDWNEVVGTTRDGKKVGAHDNQQGGKYQTYPVDSDNIIPICDDEYFDDDMVGRFIDFVKVVYGEETLEENLKFIADALGGKGSPRTVIRNYFLNEFYADHCKTYQKRPIYWLFDSGKKNGFKCLIYMHRYAPDTIARIRTDYVHEQQARYRTSIEDLQKRIDSASTSERVKLSKQLALFQAKDVELRDYEEKIHYFADKMIGIDLDDGVKHNYAIFQDVLAKIK